MSGGVRQGVHWFIHSFTHSFTYSLSRCWWVLLCAGAVPGDGEGSANQTAWELTFIRGSGRHTQRTYDGDRCGQALTGRSACIKLHNNREAGLTERVEGLEAALRHEWPPSGDTEEQCISGPGGG